MPNQRILSDTKKIKPPVLAGGLIGMRITCTPVPEGLGDYSKHLVMWQPLPWRYSHGIQISKESNYG